MQTWKKRTDSKTLEDVISKNIAIHSKNLDNFLKDKEFTIPNVTEAVSMIHESVAKGEFIKIVGDYDVDGLMAVSILFIFLSSIHAKVSARIPRRISEGYGLNESIIDEIENGLVITVDNGISSIAAIDKAKEKGLKVLLTDHHLPFVDDDGKVQLPNADLIVNAHIKNNGFEEYCGAAVAYKIAEAYLGKGHAVLEKLLPYAAIATIADVVPLYGENRSIVKKGLRQINKGIVTSGLKKLLHSLYMTGHVRESDVAFKIGPMLNAPGRLEDSGGLRVLEVFAVDKERDKEEIQIGAIKQINEKRKEIVQNWVLVSDNMIGEDKSAPIIVKLDNAQEGIIGIIASSLTEKYRMPALVCTNVKDGILKGSGRSVDSVHLKQLLDKNNTLLLKYGGHAKAAGFSLKDENFCEVKKHLKAELQKYEPDTNVYYDLEIESNQVEAMKSSMEKYAPYGEGNPEPRFLIKNIQIKEATPLKNTHIKMSTEGADVIGFGMLDEYKSMGSPNCIDIICTISSSWFMGVETITLLVDYFRPADGFTSLNEDEIPSLESLLEKRLKEESK